MFSLLSVLSLVLCVAGVGLWVRSQWVWEGVVVSGLLRENDPAADLAPMDSYRTACIQTADGLIMAGGGVTYEQSFGRARRWTGDFFSRRPPLVFRDSSTPWRRLGFLVDSGPDGLTYASIPLWVVVIGFSVLPAYSLVKRRRRGEGSCRHCGYDLKGNVSGVCPECGVAVARKGEA